MCYLLEDSCDSLASQFPATSPSGLLPLYTPPTVLPVTPGTNCASESTAPHSRGVPLPPSGRAQGWLKGMVAVDWIGSSTGKWGVHQRGSQSAHTRSASQNRGPLGDLR